MPKLAFALAVLLLMTRGSSTDAQVRELSPNDPHRIKGMSIGGGGPGGFAQSYADFFAGDGPGPHPVVILVHGGGFSTAVVCIRSEGYCADFLAPAGYAVFALDYRLLGGATFAEMVTDVQRWVRYVRHSADAYDIDPNKIALLGASAGGALSTRAGLALPSHGPKTYYDWDTESDEVQAVVTLDGIRNITAMPDPRLAEKTGLLGTESKTSASPLPQVREHAPPSLFLHGNRDDAASTQQSTVLLEALHKAGNTAELITIPNGSHVPSTVGTLPEAPEWERELTVWLNQTLHHNGSVGADIVASPAATSR